MGSEQLLGSGGSELVQVRAEAGVWKHVSGEMVPPCFLEQPVTPTPEGQRAWVLPG